MYIFLFLRYLGKEKDYYYYFNYCVFSEQPVNIVRQVSLHFSNKSADTWHFSCILFTSIMRGTLLWYRSAQKMHPNSNDMHPISRYVPTNRIIAIGYKKFLIFLLIVLSVCRLHVDFMYNMLLVAIKITKFVSGKG